MFSTSYFLHFAGLWILVHMSSYINVPGVKNMRVMNQSYSVSKSECALLCKYTPSCRGMIYMEDTKVCKHFEVDSFKFKTTRIPGQSIYLRHFAFAGAPEYILENTCPTEKSNENYLSSLTRLDAGGCPELSSLYGEVKVSKRELLHPIHQGNTFKLAPVCTGNSCRNTCTGDRHLVVRSNGTVQVFRNIVDSVASCFDGQWYFIANEVQIAYAVEAWSCVDEAIECPDNLWSLEGDRCYWAAGVYEANPWKSIERICGRMKSTGVNITGKHAVDIAIRKMLSAGYGRAAINLQRNETGYFDITGKVRYADDSYIVQNAREYHSGDDNGFGYVDSSGNIFIVPEDIGSIYCIMCEFSTLEPKSEPETFRKYKKLQKVLRQMGRN